MPKTDWQQVPLGSVADLIMGQSPPGDTVRDEGKGIPFLQGNAEFGSVSPSARLVCIKPLKVCEPSDSLISVRAPVGALNVANQRFAIGRGLAAIRFHGIDPQFGRLALQIHIAQLYRVAQGTTFEAVGQKELASIRISTPINRREQRRIAEILDTLDEVISHSHACISKLRLLQAGTISRLMTQGISGSASSWPQFTCKEAFILSSGTPYPASQTAEGKTPIYGASGISGYGNRQLTLGPTFTIGRVGEGGVGVVHYVPGPAWITDNALWATSINPGWNTEFIARYLSWFNLRKVRSQTGQPLVTQGIIGPLPIPKPPKAEQVQIVSVLQNLDEAEKKCRAELGKLTILKQGLMEDLLTGRVRVSEAEAVLENL